MQPDSMRAVSFPMLSQGDVEEIRPKASSLKCWRQTKIDNLATEWFAFVKLAQASGFAPKSGDENLCARAYQNSLDLFRGSDQPAVPIEGPERQSLMYSS